MREWRDKQRLIMNLVLGNRLQLRLDAGQGELPHSGQWVALHMLEEKVFLGSVLDRMCYFYCFRLPAAW